MFAFTRAGDEAAQAFARELGAVWAGGSEQAPPEPLDAAIIFAPDGALVPRRCARCAPGGDRRLRRDPHERHPSLPLQLLWEERSIRSVANLTRARRRGVPRAGSPGAGAHPREHAIPLERANEALEDLRHGRFTGAAVLIP